MGVEKPIPLRLMMGHLQRRFQYKKRPYTYSAFELGFPAFHGQIGSSVILNDMTSRAREKVVVIVTEWISFTSEIDGNVSAAFWAIGASPFPLSDWIYGLPTE